MARRKGHRRMSQRIVGEKRASNLTILSVTCGGGVGKAAVPAEHRFQALHAALRPRLRQCHRVRPVRCRPVSPTNVHSDIESSVLPC